MTRMGLRASRPAGLTVLLLGLLAVSPGRAQVVEYYHTDAIGNVRAITDASGNVIERHDYQPYGEEWLPQGGAQPLRFTGKERDAETGLDYFGARYYGSKIGRFTTVDPYMDTSAALLNPQRWNRYSYGLNNPLRNVDPDGRDAWDIATGAANAFGSNFSLGLGRQSGNSDFAKGQFLGDAASIPAGYAWGDVGATLAGAGLIGAPETGGVTLVATGAGVAIMVQGGAASLAGIANAGIYLSKNKTASDMANDLAGRIGKNSVPFETPGQKGRIDLQGKGHFDKATGQTIETPHVQTRPKHVGPQGKVNTGPETTRPATKGDIRTAEKLVERKQ